MSTAGREGLHIRDVFSTFRPRRTPVHALSLATGLAVCLATSTIVGAVIGPLATITVASATTGAYFGVLYASALGGPMWDIALPGLVVSVVLRLPPAGVADSLSGGAAWVSALCAYGTVGLAVWAWHRHLGDDRADWARSHLPASFLRFLGSDGT